MFLYMKLLTKESGETVKAGGDPVTSRGDYQLQPIDATPPMAPSNLPRMFVLIQSFTFYFYISSIEQLRPKDIQPSYVILTLVR